MGLVSHLGPHDGAFSKKGIFLRLKIVVTVVVIRQRTILEEVLTTHQMCGGGSEEGNSDDNSCVHTWQAPSIRRQHISCELWCIYN